MRHLGRVVSKLENFLRALVNAIAARDAFRLVDHHCHEYHPFLSTHGDMRIDQAHEIPPHRFRFECIRIIRKKRLSAQLRIVNGCMARAGASGNTSQPALPPRTPRALAAACARLVAAMQAPCGTDSPPHSRPSSDCCSTRVSETTSREGKLSRPAAQAASAARCAPLPGATA